MRRDVFSRSSRGTIVIARKREIGRMSVTPVQAHAMTLGHLFLETDSERNSEPLPPSWVTGSAISRHRTGVIPRPSVSAWSVIHLLKAALPLGNPLEISGRAGT
jgi:hypothetical protein